VIVAVSGGASGIGLAIVTEGRARGWDARGGGRRTGLDVRDPASIDAFLGEHVDAAVACAGVSIDSLFVTMDLEDARAVLETNLTGAFLFSRAAVRRGARAVLLVGSLHQLGAPSNAVYAASKAALMGLAEAMNEAWPHVRTNVIIPGFVATDMSASLPPEAQGRLVTGAAIGRPVSAIEVANAAADMLQSSLRGRAVRVSGGLLETPL
jgi:NAD(P)-dependent dehydrogenase (short-subunit alcohol dehydrogenase family)